jgi:putative oxidoreductase
MDVTKWLDNHKDIGILLLRLFIGIRLVYGVADNVLSWHHMLLFRDFLATAGFPLPLLSAVVSVYAQLAGGIMIITGFWIRLGAAAMIINFIVALLMVHRQDSFEGMTPALAMLFASLLFLFYGAGKFSLGNVWQRNINY